MPTPVYARLIEDTHVSTVDVPVVNEGPRNHYVYFASNELGHLLYIGRTIDVFARMAGHRQTSAWYPQMAHLKVETYSHKDAARIREKDLIARLAPPHNKQFRNEVLAYSRMQMKRLAEDRKVPPLIR